MLELLADQLTLRYFAYFWKGVIIWNEDKKYHFFCWLPSGTNLDFN